MSIRLFNSEIYRCQFSCLLFFFLVFLPFFPIIPFSLSLFLLFLRVSSFPFPLPNRRFGCTFSTARPWLTRWIITTIFSNNLIFFPNDTHNHNMQNPIATLRLCVGHCRFIHVGERERESGGAGWHHHLWCHWWS